MGNRYFIVLLSFILIFGFESCTDWLSIKPESEIILDDYWQNEAQAQAVLTACYRGLTTNDNMERLIVWGELRSDNVVDAGLDQKDRGDMREILNVNILPTNKYCSWASMYAVINNCNTFLHYAPGVLNVDKNFSPGKLRTLEAEALTIRALCYFYLVRTFRDVPWINTPSIDDTQDYTVTKSPESEVLDSIIANLKTAQISARNELGSIPQNKGRITLNAVNALLADVYLWDQKYSDCIDMCNRVMNDKSNSTNEPTFTLVSGIQAGNMLKKIFYTGNSTESIFELQFNESVQKSDATHNLYGSLDKTGELSFTIPLEIGDKGPFNLKQSGNIESGNDSRFKDFIVQPRSVNDKTGIYPIFKYVGYDRTEDQQGNSTYRYTTSSSRNWIVYRLADVILMKAEALVADSTSTDDNLKEALDMVNITYTRSNPKSSALSFTDYNTKTDLEKLVLRERQRELLFEGKRWFDLMRLTRRNRTTSSLLEYVIPKLKFTDGDPVMEEAKMSVMDGLYFPVPQSDIDVNPNLKQNPFYETTNTIN